MPDTPQKPCTVCGEIPLGIVGDEGLYKIEFYSFDVERKEPFMKVNHDACRWCFIRINVAASNKADKIAADAAERIV